MPKKKPADAAENAVATLPETSTPAAVPDETDESNAKETAASAAEMARLREQIKNLESRLSAVSQADQFIVQAELEATRAQDELAEADKVRKECKKRADAALENLRKTVRDRMSGQTLFTFEAKAEPAKKPKSATTEKATAETVPTEPDDLSERPTAPIVETPADTDPIFGVSLGSISVPGLEPDEMVGIPPGVLETLKAAGLHTVKDLVEKIENGGLKIKGLGPVKVDQLTDVLVKWTNGAKPTDAKPAQPAADATPKKREAGEATHCGCGDCGHRWPLPSELDKCPKCGQDLIYQVGYFGEPGADAEGNLVLDVEQILLRIDQDPFKEYGFSVQVVKGSDGLYRNGWEILHADADDEGVYPSILLGPATDRDTAVRLGFGGLRDEIASRPDFGAQFNVWEEAAKKRFGCEPLLKLEPAA